MRKTILTLIQAGLLIACIASGNALAENAGSVEAGAENMTVLDIETAGRIALKNNPSIQAVKERLTQAGEAVKQARADYYPTLDASTTLSKTDYSRTSGIADKDETYGAELSATWVLFNGFSRKLTLESARYGRMSEIEAGNDAKRLLLLSVAESYYNIQLALENMATARADITYYTKLLEDARLKQKAGTGSRSDVLSFQVQVNSAESSFIDAEKEYRIARTGLAAIMGYESSRLPEGTILTSLESGINNRAELPDLSRLIEYAENNRPDIKQLDYEVKQTEKSIGIAKSGYYPKVSLFGTWNGEREDDAGFEGDDFGNTAGITVSMNIFSGGSTRSGVNEARAAKREAELGLRDRKTTMKKEITSAWHELDNAIRQLDLQEASTALVKENRDLVEAAYKAGKASIVRLTEAQSDLVKTRSLYLQAAANLRLALEKIKAYTGTNQLIKGRRPFGTETNRQIRTGG